jgi:D-alanyl-D-alanine carboxypeptidase
VKRSLTECLLILIAIIGLQGWPVKMGLAQPAPSPSVTTSQSATAPATSAAGDRMDEILKLFESSDYSKIAPLVHSSFAPDFLAGQGERDFMSYLADTMRRTGGIHRGKVTTQEKDAIGFFRSNLTGRWGVIALSVEAAAPYRISSLQIQRAKAPTAGASMPSEKKRLAEVSDLASKLAKVDLFSGVVIIARNDRPIFTKTYGLADRSFNVATAADTRFLLGGIDKSFTAVAIAQLVEAGKLSYDDPLSKFLNYPDPASAAKIQIKHLLSNTSGLGDYLTDKYFANVRRLRDVQSYLTILDNKPPGFAPGTDWQDSSIGYLLLGRIIELVSGEDYYEYIQHHIFEPAGMQHSFQEFLQRSNSKLAIRYEDYFQKDHFVTAIYGYVTSPPVRGAPDNATVAPAEDVVRFVAALRNGKLISPETYKLLTTPKPELGAKTYGYGFAMESSDEGRDVIGQGGDAPGLCTDYALIRDLKDPYTVVVLSNHSNTAHVITESIVSLYSSQPTAP